MCHTAVDKWGPVSACDVKLPLHVAHMTFLLVHKYCSLHGGVYVLDIAVDPQSASSSCCSLALPHLLAVDG